MAQHIRIYEAGDPSGPKYEKVSVGEPRAGQVGMNQDVVGDNFVDTMFRDIVADLLDRIRLSGTPLFHYELGRPWCLALPRRPDAVFHYLSRGSAIIEFEDGQALPMSAGDFVMITRGEPHVMWSGRRIKPSSLLDLDRRPAHLGVIHHGGGQQPFSTVICGFFSPLASSVLDLLPSVLNLTPATEDDWLETILRRLVSESAAQRPGQDAVLSRMTEVLFVEVLRSWIKSLRPGEGRWLGAITDAHIGKALRLIHERPAHRWTIRELGRRAGLGRSAFAARFARLVGQPVHRYLLGRRMEEAALMLESSDDTIARIAVRVGYQTRTAFSKVFCRHHGLSPGRYRAQKASWRRAK
jgi:AraC-like DNA-binding protein